MIALNTQSGLKLHQGGLDSLKYQKGPWTRFRDMYSSGSAKVENYEYIYIQMAEEYARVLFYKSFDRDPDNTACDCCGPDYSVGEYPTLEEATEYERACLRLGEKDLVSFAAHPTQLVVITQEQPEEVTGA